MAVRIGAMLVSANLVTEDQIKQALAQLQKEGGRLVSSLVKMGFIDEQKLITFLSRQYGIPAVNLSDVEIDPNVTKLIPPDVVQKYQIFPTSRTGATITLAMADPSNIFAIDDLKTRTHYQIQPIIATENDIREAIRAYYGQWAQEISKVLEEVGPSESVEIEKVADEDEKIDQIIDYDLKYSIGGL